VERCSDPVRPALVAPALSNRVGLEWRDAGVMLLRNRMVARGPADAEVVRELAVATPAVAETRVAPAGAARLPVSFFCHAVHARSLRAKKRANFNFFALARGLLTSALAWFS